MLTEPGMLSSLLWKDNSAHQIYTYIAMAG